MSHFVLYLGLSASLVQRCEQMCKHMFSHIAINIDQDQALLYSLIYKIRNDSQSDNHIIVVIHLFGLMILLTRFVNIDFGLITIFDRLKAILITYA